MSSVQKIGSAQRVKSELIRRLEDALRVLDLPSADEMAIRNEGETRASLPFKCGYAKGAIKGALADLRNLKVRA